MWLGQVGQVGCVLSSLLPYPSSPSSLPGLPRIADSITKENLSFLEDKLGGRTWGSLEGMELQNSGSWKPLMRSFAFHCRMSMANAKRKGWLENDEYKTACKTGDNFSFQSADTPAAAVAMWVASAVALDPPTSDVVVWPSPDLDRKQDVKCTCNPPMKAKKQRERYSDKSSKSFFVCVKVRPSSFVQARCLISAMTDVPPVVRSSGWSRTCFVACACVCVASRLQLSQCEYT